MIGPHVMMPEEIRAELDRTFSSVAPPAVPPSDLGTRSWDCLAGEAPAVVCECGHAWLEVHS